MFKDLFKFKINTFSFGVSLIFVIGGWIWAYLALRGASTPLILRFNAQGINQVGYFWDLAKVGIFGLGVVAVNFLISIELERRDRFLGKLAAVFTFFLSVLIFIYFAAIISVN